MAVGNATIDCRVVALGGFQVTIPLISDIAEAWHAHARRLGKKRNEIAFNSNIRRQNTSKSHPIIDHAGFADSLLRLYRAFQPLGSKGRDINRIVIKSGKGKPPIRVVEPARRFIAQQSTLLQPPGIRFEGDGMVAAAKIKPGYGERYARANARLS